MTLKIGDRVRCINGTNYHNIEGTVTAIDHRPFHSWPYAIRWDRDPNGNMGGAWGPTSIVALTIDETEAFFV